MTSIVEALVPGGKANPGPPLGPALGPLGVNIKEVVEKINEKTRDYNGMQVPVKIIVDDKKNVEIEVGTPPTASLIMKELGIQKGIRKRGKRSCWKPHYPAGRKDRPHEKGRCAFL